MFSSCPKEYLGKLATNDRDGGGRQCTIFLGDGMGGWEAGCDRGEGGGRGGGGGEEDGG